MVAALARSRGHSRCGGRVRHRAVGRLRPALVLDRHQRQDGSLWDWLHLLLLPLAFGLLPILLSRDTRLKPQHKLLVAIAIGAMGVFILAGYMIPWSWTGFGGNKLWDWLELLVLPLTIALIPVLRDIHIGWNRRRTLVALATLTVFVAIVIAGYVGDWDWTGFRGNKLWDWLHLLLLPLLLPTVIVPAMRSSAQARMIVPSEPESVPSKENPSSSGPPPPQTGVPW